ncbi:MULTISPECIES: RNA-guided endonuclease TnpB family protein [unclassified Microcoleus]|uniref:RNA-guided endonuclease InsQ/TnpB family protein n=1 Tax=unclassified Microcoleus TaxID=2642155 RepID=UPI0025D43B87|nr:MULTISPECIES: RNA-guided endonuclease TnpB family protein [unclassified Microcoleus]
MGLYLKLLPFQKKEIAGRVSFCVDAQGLPVQQPEGSVGIDVGVKSFVTLSNSQVFDAPKPLKQAKTKLARLQGKAHRQIKGSNNQRKTYSKLRRLARTIACIRKDFLHKLTTYLAKTFKLIKIEDLNVRGWLANHKLARAISDLGFYEFRRQLEYKCKMYGASLVLIDRWFPSSKICASCGHKKDMPLAERIYNCPACGVLIDRDLNARQEYFKLGTQGYWGIACLSWDGRPPNSAGSEF